MPIERNDYNPYPDHYDYPSSRHHNNNGLDDNHVAAASPT
jgi:hypothetical protein